LRREDGFLNDLGVILANAPALVYTPSSETLNYEAPARQSLSPVGQASFLLRLGVAESDRLSYFGGISYEIPISLGVHLVSVRIDGDIWEHFSSPSGGGTALSANALFGPNSGYLGAGLAYTARINHASGPEGPGIKLIAGAQPIPVLGYEFSAIVADRGVMGAVMATLRF
jgi:hypothetical protein